MDHAKKNSNSKTMEGYAKAALILRLLPPGLANRVAGRLDTKEVTNVGIQTLAPQAIGEKERTAILQEFFSTIASARLVERLQLMAEAYPERVAEKLRSLWTSD